MTSASSRPIVAAASICAFFLLWASVAARPWAASAPAPIDPRAKALARREVALKRRAAKVNALVDRRWAAYRVALARRRLAIAHVEQVHVQQLERAYASAVRALRTANAQTVAARSYAAQVVSWANAVAVAPSAAPTPTPVPAASAAPPAPAAVPAAPAPAPAPAPVVVAPPATTPVTKTSSSSHK